MTDAPVAADPRRKLERFTRAIVNSKSLQQSGGMVGSMLVSLMPMVTTMLEKAKPESVAGFCSLLAKAFEGIADPAVSESDFDAQLAEWTSD